MRRLSVFVVLLLALAVETHAQSSWRILDRPTTRNLSRLCYLDSLRGWVVGDSGTILRTTNGGVNWTVQNSNTLHRLVDVFMVDDNHGWALAHNYEWQDTTYGTTILRTVNGGIVWSGQVYRNEFFTTVFFFDSSDGFMGGAFGSIVRSTDGGENWMRTQVDSSAVSGFPILRLRFYSRNYGYGVGGWLDLSGAVWRTTNGGMRWITTAVSPEPIHDLFFIDSTNIMSVGGDFDFGSGMVATSDAGLTWEYTYLGIWGEARALAVRTLTEIYSPLGFAGTYMYTLDSGQTWCSAYTPDSSAMFDATFVDSLTGYMVGERGTVLKYVRPPAPMIILNRDSLIVHEANSWTDSFYVRNCGSALVVDSIVLHSSEPVSYSLSIQPTSFTVPYGDTQVVRVRVTAAGARGTFDFEDSLFIYSNDPLNPVKIVVMQGDYLSDAPSDIGLPFATALLQNYPNPFNPATEIRYQIADVRWVRLRVFDLLGCEIIRLVDELQRPGEHAVTWDAGSVAGGVYFYQLIAGDYVETRKMLVVK